MSIRNIVITISFVSLMIDFGTAQESSSTDLPSTYRMERQVGNTAARVDAVTQQLYEDIIEAVSKINSNTAANETTKDRLDELKDIDSSLASIRKNLEEKLSSSEFDKLFVEYQKILEDLKNLALEEIEDAKGNSKVEIDSIRNTAKTEVNAHKKDAISELQRKVDEINDLTESLQGTREELEENISAFEDRSSQTIAALNSQAEDLQVKIETLATQTEKIEDAILLDARQKVEIANHSSRFWLLVSAILVFFMQAGFKCLELGFVRKISADHVGLKNLLDWLAASIAFYLIGFHIMFAEQIFRADQPYWFFSLESLAQDGYPNSTDSDALETLAYLENRFAPEETDEPETDFPQTDRLSTDVSEEPHAVLVDAAESDEGLKKSEGDDTAPAGIGSKGSRGLGMEFFLFQLAFAGTAATIVSGAVAGRVSRFTYLGLSIVITGFAYPIFGRLAWGGLYIDTESHGTRGLLSGFHDFAGGTVVHLIGAVAAFWALQFLGQRRRSDDLTITITESGEDNHFKPANLSISALGVIFLWFGWWGFNGGSSLKFDAHVAEIILYTNIAGASGGVVSYVHAAILSARRGGLTKSDQLPVTIGGILGGLVAITPCADIAVMSPKVALVVGLFGGLGHNLGYILFAKRRWLGVDDPVGVLAVHGIGGIIGTMVASFAVFDSEWNMQGNLLGQFGMQLRGILIAIMISSVFTTSFFMVFRNVFNWYFRDDVVEHTDVEISDITDLKVLLACDGQDEEFSMVSDFWSFKRGPGWSEPKTFEAYLDEQTAHWSKNLSRGVASATPATRLQELRESAVKSIRGLKVKGVQLSPASTESVVAAFLKSSLIKNE